MRIEQLIGPFAVLFSVIGFMPQVIKTLVTKKTSDVALAQPVMIALGMVLWSVYGVMIKDFVIITSNILIFSLNLVVIIMKLKYKKLV